MNPSPYVGYKYGVVQPMLEPIYESYFEITEKYKEYIKAIKEVFYLAKNNKMTKELAKKYLDILVMAALDYPTLRSYSNEALKAIVN